MPNEIDPRLLSRLAANRTTRRRFIGGGAAAAAALTLGPSFLAACGGGDQPSGAPATTTEDTGAASGTLRISNWPLYMADGFVACLPDRLGHHRGLQGRLERQRTMVRQDQGTAVAQAGHRRRPGGTDQIPGRPPAPASAGSMTSATPAGPTRSNLRTDLLEASVDPDRKFSAPYMSGLVGLAYNRAATGRDITTIDDMWDPAFKGRVSMFSDFQDGLGMIMLSQGSSVDQPDHRDHAEGDRRGQGAEGQGPDPAIHRQRLRRRSRRRESSWSPKRIRATSCSCRPTTPTCSSWPQSQAQLPLSTPW